MDRMDYDEIVPQMKYFICRHCSPSWVMNESVIDFIDLTYLFEGRATYTINGIAYEAEKGDLICAPRGSVRYAEIDPNNPMSCYASNIWLVNIQGSPMDLPFPVHSKLGICDDIMSMYHELNREWINKKSGYSLKVCSLLMGILHRYFSLLYYKNNGSSYDPRIQTVIKYMYNNIEASISVDDLAGLVGLNASYFGTLFSKTTGFSVKEYINRIKIDNAENLISSGEFSVSEAARRSGFNDMFYFSKIFKKIRGYSPSKVVLNMFVNKSTSRPS